MQSSISTANLWHKRQGYLSFSSMNKLAREVLVTDFGYKANSSNGFCDACVERSSKQETVSRQQME